MIPERQADAEEHVQDAENDGDLHLESVEENNFVVGDLPDRVDAKRVRVSVPALFLRRIYHVVLPAQDVLEQFIPEHLPLRSKSGTVSFFIILIFRLLAYTSTLSYMYWYTVPVPAVRYIPVPVYKLSLLIMILK